MSDKANKPNDLVRALALGFTLLRVLGGAKPEDVIREAAELAERGKKLRDEIQGYMGEETKPDA